MVELNNIYLHAFVMVNKFFQKHKLNYYPTSIGTAYKEIFKRDTFGCLSFYDTHKVQYYLYFNASYNSDINRMVFTSISVVSRDNLNRKASVTQLKHHIETIQDIENFLKLLEGMI